MLTYWETDSLLIVFENEGENARVPGDDFLAGEDSFCPDFGLEEDFSGAGGFGRYFVGILEDFAGGFVEGADVVGWHHSFGCFGVWCLLLRYNGMGE